MKTKKKGMGKYREAIIFLVILALSSFLLPKGSKGEAWIVLPIKINPYVSSRLDKKDSKVTLKYPQEISGEIIGEAQSAVLKFMVDDVFYYLPLQILVKKIDIDKKHPNLEIGSEKVDIETPLSHKYKPDDLLKINQDWNYHAADYAKYLREDAAKALDEMFSEAKKAGLSLKVVSAYRSFKKQRQLYLRAINKNGMNQNVVAKPGHSEHQLGTTIDVSSFSPKLVLNQGFGETKEGKWMAENAHRFGFSQSYTKDNFSTSGYIPEPWHFRYKGR